jgi:hypothetical protein
MTMLQHDVNFFVFLFLYSLACARSQNGLKTQLLNNLYLKVKKYVFSNFNDVQGGWMVHGLEFSV